MSAKNKQEDLRIAASNGRIEDVKKYLSDDTVNVNAKDYYEWTALHCACNRGHDDIAEFLLDHGADIDSVTKKHKHTPLMMACLYDHASTTKLLLGRGSKVTAVNKNGRTALHLACSRGSIKCVEELLAHGVDTSSAKKQYGKAPLNKGFGGWTALHYACDKGHDDIAELLLKCGADIEAVTNGNSIPLMKACFYGHAPTTKLLLERGSKVNAVNNRGNTALHIACWTGSEHCVKELLAHGADTSIKNKNGKTPLDMAQDREHHHSIIDLLTVHKKDLKQPVTKSVQDAKKSTMSEEGFLKGNIPECRVLISPSEEEQLSSKVESIIDRRCEELRRDVMNLKCNVETIIDRQCEEMNQSFEALAKQLTISNAEVVKCVSNLSTTVGHLSSKVSTIEGQCAELCDMSERSKQEWITQSLQASNLNAGAFDGEKKMDTVEDFEFI